VKKFALLTLTIAMLMGMGTVPSAFAADDIKPVVTVSFAGYDEVVANIDAIGKLSGKPDLAKGLEGILAIMTQGKGLAGLDKKAPWGMLVQVGEDGQPAGFGFLPATDLKQLMDVLMNSPAGSTIKEDEGVYEIEGSDGETFYLAQRGKIAAIVKDKSDLDNVPSDPEKLLGDLPKKFLVAVRVSVANVPESLRDQMLAGYGMLLNMAMQKEDGESDEAYARRSKVMQRGVEQITMIVKELNYIDVGLNIDRSTSKTYLDLEVVAKEGTKLAEEISRAKPGKTDLAGFQSPAAAVVLNAIRTMTDKEVEDAKDTILFMKDQGLKKIEELDVSEEQKESLTALLDDAIELAEKNLETKKTDFGALVRLEPEAITLVAGTSVADGKAVEDLVKKILDLAKKEEPSLGDRAKFNTETYKGVRFHTFSIPVPGEEPKRFVGDELDFVLGVSDKQAFVAVGRDAAKMLKEVIDKSQASPGKEIPPSQVIVSALAIARFVAEAAEDDEVKGPAQAAVGLLEKAEGKDHLTITGTTIPNGARVRFELEEGFLKMIGGAADMLGGLGMAPDLPEKTE
jgi:hypothetical protein